MGLDLATVAGTGRFGRVTEADVEQALGIAKPKKVELVPAASGEAAQPMGSAPSGLSFWYEASKASVATVFVTLNTGTDRVASMFLAMACCMPVIGTEPMGCAASPDAA